MREVVAGLIAVALLVFALLLMTALQIYRRRRESARAAAERHGRRLVAELPAGVDLVLVTEDRDRLYYGDRAIEKADIRAVQVLVNGSPIASRVSRRFPEAGLMPPTTFEPEPEGILRDRWDVAIDTSGGLVLIECGAIRERVSQEIARAIFDAVSAAIEDREGG
jgi:hypothetical protein